MLPLIQSVSYLYTAWYAIKILMLLLLQVLSLPYTIFKCYLKYSILIQYEVCLKYSNTSTAFNYY